MEAYAEDAVWEFALLGVKTSYDAEKNTFASSSSAGSTTTTTTVRHVIDKRLPARDAITGSVMRDQFDTFTGIIDGVTGEIIHGTRTYVATGEIYEGPFSYGGKRHGDGAIVQNIAFRLAKPSLFFSEQAEENELISPQQLPAALSLSYSKAKFFGAYRNDEPFHGTLVTDTFTYVGSFQNRLFNGRNGELIHANGDKYTGGFEEGAFDGKGQETDYTGEYQGEFRKGLRHGKGIFQARVDQAAENDLSWSKTEGYSYTGVYRRGRKHGEGVERTPEGDVYTGLFWADQRHGAGRLRNRRSGIIYEGSWHCGKPVEGDDWRVRYPNGDQYIGSAKNCIPHGHGMYRYKNGSCFAGEFRHGRVCNSTTSGKSCTKNPLDKQTGAHLADPLRSSERGKTSAISVDGGVSTSPTYAQQRRLVLEACSSSMSSSLNMIQLGCGASYDSPTSRSNYVERGKYRTSTVPQLAQLEEKQLAMLRHFDDTGDIFLGTWDEVTGKNGFGFFISRTTGCFYMGHYHHNKRHGFGILLHPEIGRYAGEFRNDKKVGLGTLILSDTSCYHGYFVSGSFHGKGTLKENDGTVYVGEWSNGFRSGFGVETKPDGSRYSGNFKDGKRHGKGTLVDKIWGRVVYTGEWRDDVYHGQGIFMNRQRVIESADPVENRRSAISVTRFEGNFANGHRHGFGAFINGDGLICKGTWSNNKPVQGKWRITYIDGSIYSGQANVDENDPLNFQNIASLIIPDGFGTMKYANGDVYCGNFVDGKRHGTGTWMYANGGKREGEWMDDHIHTTAKGQMPDGALDEYLSQNDSSAGNSLLLPKSAWPYLSW